MKSLAEAIMWPLVFVLGAFYIFHYFFDTKLEPMAVMCIVGWIILDTLWAKLNKIQSLLEAQKQTSR